MELHFIFAGTNQKHWSRSDECGQQKQGNRRDTRLAPGITADRGPGLSADQRLHGGPGLQKARCPCGQRLYGRTSARDRRRRKCRSWTGATICQRRRYFRRLVDRFPFQAAGRSDRGSHFQQSHPEGGAGSPDGGAGKHPGTTGKLLPQADCGLLGHAQSGPAGGAGAHPQRQRPRLQSVHAAVGHLLCARCVRPEPAHGGIPRGAGTRRALSARRRLYHPQHQCRGRRDPDRIAGDADRGHPGAYRRQHRQHRDVESGAVSIRQRLFQQARSRRAADPVGADQRVASRPHQATRAAARSAGRSGRTFPEPGVAGQIPVRLPFNCRRTCL